MVDLFPGELALEACQAEKDIMAATASVLSVRAKVKDGKKSLDRLVKVEAAAREHVSTCVFAAKLKEALRVDL